MAGIIDDDFEKLLRRQEEVMRLLAIMVYRAGGEVVILPGELQRNHTLSRSSGFHGAIELKLNDTSSPLA